MDTMTTCSTLLLSLSRSLRSPMVHRIRFGLLLCLVGVSRVYAQSSASCIPYGSHGDDDDDDDDDDGEGHSSTSSATLPYCSDSMGTGTWTRSGHQTWSGSWTATATGSATGGSGSLGATQVGSNADISVNGFNKSSIAGIVIGAIIGLIIGAYLICCLRRRYMRRKRQEQLANRIPTLGPTFLASSNPAGTKEGNQTQVMANVGSRPLFPPGLYRTSSRSSLPQIPDDTPAYTSTDHLASPLNRAASTTVSYSSPSESTGATAATAGHGTGGGGSASPVGSAYGNIITANRHASLQEEMSVTQKELEVSYRRMELGLDHQSGVAGSTSAVDATASRGNLHEQPPPRYNA